MFVVVWFGSTKVCVRVWKRQLLTTQTMKKKKKKKKNKEKGGGIFFNVRVLWF
jgi:hypothetical protein